MKVSEGWRRIFIALSAAYWLVALVASMQSAMIGAGPETGPWPALLVINLIFSAIIYGALAGLVAVVIWIMAGFRKPKPDAE